MTAVFFNPLQDGFTEDPWTHLAELRESEPVHALLTGGYALFRYDDVFALLRDPELSVDDRNADLTELDRGTLLEEFDDDMEFESILGLDPPDHTRLRRLISKAFTPRTIEALRPRIEQMVDDALDRMADAGTADVVGELAFPLPFDVISEMLGLPDVDKEQIRDWSGAIVKTLDPIISDEEMVAAFEANRNIDGYLADVIEWKRKNPAEDILTAMIEAEEAGDRMSPKELRDQVNLLFVAGHETTVNLIGTGIRELLDHPDQATLLRDDPSLDANAVDELLRWVAPVQMSRRITLKATEVRGVEIPARAFVSTSLASANRDPEKFGPAAGELDLARADAGQHVSFGSGIHYCLGASLAKLEGQFAIGRFVRRFPNAAIAAEPVWNGRINLRGLDELQVAVN
ncbi:MAG: cytochrome P450 [Acidimicrobiales bacterium]|jgi:cytochrome P450|nr:cytochrome P450 [Acidimicrobiales bacterium]